MADEEVKKETAETPSEKREPVVKPKPKVKPKLDMNAIIEVKNIGNRSFYGIDGLVKPGEKGKLTEHNARRFRRLIERL